MSYTEHSVEGVAILLWATDPERPERLATPFFHAAAAAAMDMPVEVFFTAASVHLLVPGVAAALRASPRVDKTVLAHMQDAAGHGARFFACSDALAAHGLTDTPLIPEGSSRGGAVQFMARALDVRWRTLVF
jgi:predicted peroxiredoxin